VGELTRWTWIAACCLARELPLATLNLKDFADFVEHEGPSNWCTDGLDHGTTCGTNHSAPRGA
jgi:hypothetical protein